jgi:hypothetical protein
MRAPDEIHTRRPFSGQRELVVLLRGAGYEAGRKKVSLISASCSHSDFS